MPIPVRSIRLQRRSSQSLDTLSGASGEIFFDADRNTLRLYTANQADSIIMADRTWVLENTFDGDYNSLTNGPSIPSDVSQLSDNFNLLFSGDYNDLTNAPDLESLNVDISTINSIGDVDTETEPLVNGQLLQWDGEKWQNATVGGFADTTYDLASSSITGGVSLTLTGSDASSDVIEIVGAGDTTVGINLSGQLEINTALSATISGLTDTAVSNPQDGQALVYNSGQWINSSVDSSGAVDFAELTNKPTTIAGYGITDAYTADQSLDTISKPFFKDTVITDTGVGEGLTIQDEIPESSSTSLRIDRLIGAFGDVINATVNTISGVDILFRIDKDGEMFVGGIKYPTADGTAGQVLTTDGAGNLSFTTVTGGGDLVNDASPELGGNLDALNNDILNVGTITATSFSSSATGAPSLTSASTITLDAPDGVIVQNGPFRLPSFTTNDKNSLVAVNGDMVYDITLNKAQVYENGAWVNLV